MATPAEQLIQKGLERGRVEGRVEGLVKGRVEGLRTTLTRLLQARFVTLPDSAHDRLARADASQLEVWLDRVLTAQQLDDVFEE